LSFTIAVSSARRSRPRPQAPRRDRASSRRRAAGPTGSRCPAPRCPAPSRAPPRRSPRARRCSPPARARAAHQPDASSERMSPNRLVVTITSNCAGLITAASPRCPRSSRPSDLPFVLLGDHPRGLEEQARGRLEDIRLVHHVTLRRSCRRAYSNAYRTMRRQPSRVITRWPGRVPWVVPTLKVRSNRRTSLGVLADDDEVDVGVAAAGHDRLHRRTLAYSSNSWRSATFTER